MKQFFARRGKLSSLSDSELVALAKRDDAAFGTLYERYLQKMYSYIYYRTGNHQDAEDLSARVFQRAFTHIGSYEERGLPFRAWLYRIAHNLVANWHRDKSKRTIITLDDYTTRGIQRDALPEQLAAASDELAQLMAAVRRLPEDRQQLLLLKFLEQLPNAEIGRIMGRSEGAIKSLYHRTLLALREDLQATQALQAPDKEG